MKQDISARGGGAFEKGTVIKQGQPRRMERHLSTSWLLMAKSLDRWRKIQNTNIQHHATRVQ